MTMKMNNLWGNYQHPIPVTLATEREGTTDTLNFEPEFVKVRAPNTYYVYLDSSDAYLDLDKTNMTFTSANRPGVTASPLVNRCKRLAIVAVHLIGQISNVTPRNNTIDFRWNGADYSISIPEGVYTDASVLMAAVVAQMNTAVGSPEFSVAVDGANILYYRITGATFAFRFTGGTATTKGALVFGIPVRANLLPSVIVGPVKLEYPSRVFITSAALTNYVKHASVTTRNVPNCILEVRPNPASYLGGGITITNLAWINFEHIANISLIDVNLIDEFGEPLYVYKPYAETVPLQWGMTLLCEM